MAQGGSTMLTISSLATTLSSTLVLSGIVIICSMSDRAASILSVSAHSALDADERARGRVGHSAGMEEWEDRKRLMILTVRVGEVYKHLLCIHVTTVQNVAC